MFSLFRKKNNDPIQDLSFLGCDMHSHLIPAIDDGAQNPEDSIAFITALKNMGYSKLITTPHVMSDFHPNTSDRILVGLNLLRQILHEQKIEIEVEAAAEYFLDSYFLEEVLPKGLLSFGNNYILVEVSMYGWPFNLDEMIFAIQSRGYNVILAHPERYNPDNAIDVFHQLKEKGVLLQLNFSSIFGYYGAPVKKLALQLLKEHVYDFCGTDTHHERHIGYLQKCLAEQQTVVKSLMDYGFLNQALL